MQSAYYKYYCSQETVLLKVQDHIIKGVDRCQGVVLLLLDLSAAFDTIVHGILLNTLRRVMRMRRQCLEWIAFYLNDLEQVVLVGG